MGMTAVTLGLERVISVLTKSPGPPIMRGIWIGIRPMSKPSSCFIVHLVFQPSVVYFTPLSVAFPVAKSPLLPHLRSGTLFRALGLLLRVQALSKAPKSRSSSQCGRCPLIRRGRQQTPNILGGLSLLTAEPLGDFLRQYYWVAVEEF